MSLKCLLFIVALAAVESCNNTDWKDLNGDCFYAYTDKVNFKSWYDAHRFCQTMGAELTSIKSEEEQEFIFDNLVKNSGIYALWIGLTEINSGSYRWIDGSPKSFVHFADNQPNDKHGEEKCTFLLGKTGKWHDANCGSSYGFICREVNDNKPPATLPPPMVGGKCPDAFISEDFSNKCFYIGAANGTEKKNWNKAHDACKKINDKAELGSILSAAEQNFVMLLMEEWKSSKMWLGLHDKNGDEDYTWVDKSEFLYDNWGENQPTQAQKNKNNCAVIRKDGSWAIKDLDNKFAYLCQVAREESDEVSPHPFADQYSDSACSNGFFRYHDRCYKLIEESKTWSGASDYCNSVNSELAVPFDIYELARFTYESINMNDGRTRQVWTGANYKRATGEYVFGDEDHLVPTLFWDDNSPSLQSNDSCVAMSDGKWQDEECSKTLPFICVSRDLPDYKPTTHPDNGWCANSDHSAYKDYCYKVGLDDRVNQSEAISKCNEEGMYLASIHNKFENQFIFDLAKNVSGDDVSWWIGMASYPEAKTYKWLDGSKVNYSPWNKGEPSWFGGIAGRTRKSYEECVVMRKADGKWNDVGCYYKLSYICKVSKVFPTPSSTGETSSSSTKVSNTTTTTTATAKASAVVTKKPNDGKYNPPKQSDPTDANGSVPKGADSSKQTAAVSETSKGTDVAIVFGVLVLCVVISLVGYLTVYKKWSVVTNKIFGFKKFSSPAAVGIDNKFYKIVELEEHA